jgi:hypothetical protein
LAKLDKKIWKGSFLVFAIHDVAGEIGEIGDMELDGKAT